MIRVWIVLFFFVVLSCKKKNEKPVEHQLILQTFAPREELLKELRQRTDLLTTIDTVVSNAFVEALETENYSPIFDSKEHVEKVRFILENTRQHGFGHVFHNSLQKLITLQSKIESASLTKEEQFLAELEYRIILHKYSEIMHFGALNPAEIFEREYYVEHQKADSAWHFHQFQKENYLGFLETFRVKHPLYSSLQEKYKIISEQNENRIQLPPLKKSFVKIGQFYEGVPFLRKRFNLPEVSDTVAHYLLYDELLAEKIKEVQREYALENDGVIGAATLEMLNMTNEALALKIETVLERLRWATGQDYTNMYLINIPEFKLYVVENNQFVQTHEIGVGLVSEDHRTPEFIDTLDYIVVNPKWILPHSIVTKEILPKVKEDVFYLEQKDYKVYQSGVEQSPYAIDWHMYNEQDEFPFTFIQEPSAANALGRIKFIFPNRFHIYLHDTPSKHLFNRSMRAMSHGCIRVKNPFRLGDFVMDGDKKYIKAKESLETHRFNVKKNYPVIITYMTAIVNEEGNLRILDDVYERDQKIQDIWVNWKKQIKLDLPSL